MPKNPLTSSFEETFEQGVSSAKQHLTNTAKQITQSVASQLGVSPDSTTQKSDTSTNLSDHFNEAMQQNTAQSQQDSQSMLDIQQMESKDQEERQKKLAQTRAHLEQHKKTYFDPTFNQRKREPSVQERLEEEQKQEEAKKIEELQEEKKKELPLSLEQAMTKAEIHRGVSG
jgi:Trm5-related predicted tRNA methylase